VLKTIFRLDRNGPRLKYPFSLGFSLGKLRASPGQTAQLSFKLDLHAQIWPTKDVLNEVEFWKIHAQTKVNDRHRDTINRLLDGFEAKLTLTKWAKIEKCSQDTVLRDINELIDAIIVKNRIKVAGGAQVIL
jgi:hypothetical protein